MKTAEVLLGELAVHVQPPPGSHIILREMRSKRPTEPNWISGIGTMEAKKLLRYTDKVSKLRKTDPIIDWSGVKTTERMWRVLLFKPGDA
jgi:hypothetical protein